LPNGIIESIRIAKRSEEAPRAFLVVSFSLREAGGDLLHLAQQIKNSVDVQFSNFQMVMPEGEATEAPIHRYIADPDRAGLCQFCGAEEGDTVHDYQAPLPAEHRSMTVDGEDADVVREPLSDAAQRLINDAGVDEGPIDVAGGAHHPHRPNGIDDECAICGKPLMDEIHGEGVIAAVRHFYAVGDVNTDGKCKLCGKSEADDVHITDSEADNRVANGARQRRRG
jgi:hypothetical protein